MSDMMEVWQLCQHGEVHEHGYDFDSVCPGGKRIVLRRVEPDTNAAPLLRLADDGKVWVSDDE